MKLNFEMDRGVSARPTLFIHGNLGSLHWWRGVRREWQKHGPTGNQPMLFADWRGCGENPPWTSDLFTIEDLANDHLELLDDLEKQSAMSGPVTLVGHSLGGLIALQMMILQPERFSRALLLDPVGCKGVVFNDDMYEAFRQMAESYELTKTVILGTLRTQENLDDEWKKTLVDGAFKAVKGVGAAALEILKSVDLSAAAAKIQAPIHVLHGRYDVVISLQDSRDLVAILPNARLEVLEEAGHCWNVENPADLSGRIKRF